MLGVGHGAVGGDTLRVYAACARRGGGAPAGTPAGAVVLVYANWAATAANVSLSADASGGGGAYTGWRAEYRLTSTDGSLTGRGTSLGGAPLGVDSELEPQIVRPAAGDASGALTLEGYSLGFVVLLNASAPACA